MDAQFVKRKERMGIVDRTWGRGEQKTTMGRFVETRQGLMYPLVHRLSKLGGSSGWERWILVDGWRLCN